MQVARIQGANLDLGKPKGWDEERDGPCGSLPVRLEQTEDGGVTMTSAWTPTTEEMLAIMAGGTVYLRIVGATHPPVMLWAEAPPPDDNPYQGDHDGQSPER